MSATIAGSFRTKSRYEPFSGGRVDINGFACSLPYTLQNATGANTRSIISKLSDTVSVLDFGADRTGFYDSTNAITLAHTTNQTVYYPAGTYLVTGNNIPIQAGGILGDGIGISTIQVSDKSANDIFVFTGQTGGRFEDFTIYCNNGNQKMTGAFINVTSGGVNENVRMRFHQVSFGTSTNTQFYYPTGIHFTRASQWSVHACVFQNFTQSGILIENQNNADSGDSVISNSYFQENGGGETAIGVLQYSSGGLKIVGTKFNGGAVGYELLCMGSTSDILITGCSFENESGNAITLAQGATGIGFNNVVITGNQIIDNNGIGITSPAHWLTYVDITGNIIAGSAAISIDYVTNWNISGNVFQGPYGIILGTNFGDNNIGGQIGANNFVACGTSIALAGGAPITGPTQIIQANAQSGTGVINTTTQIGTSGIYQGHTGVAFPVPFNSNIVTTPANATVTLTSLNGVGAGVSAYNNTGMTVYAASTVNGAVPFVWEARGVF